MLRPERQFLQVGAECIGESSCLADVEMLDLAYQALKTVGIKNISIDLSSSDFINFCSQGLFLHEINIYSHFSMCFSIISYWELKSHPLVVFGHFI